MTSDFQPDDLCTYREITGIDAVPAADHAVCALQSIDRDADRYSSAIWAVPLDGGEARQLTRGLGIDEAPRWSPDARTLAFLSGRGGTSQIHLLPADGGEMTGPQADIGKGWWGKLYEEGGRGLLVKEGGEKHVKPGDWNEYVVEAVGDAVRLRINGQVCADTRDPKLARRGRIAFQLHSGGPTEVRFKDVRLEVLDKKDW